MFYMVMVLDLILIGSSFFLLYRLSREGFAVVENTAVDTPPVLKSKRGPTTRSKPKNSSKRKDDIEPENDFGIEIEDNIDWDNFGMVERDRGAFEEQKEMDETFGLKRKQTPKQKSKIDTEFEMEPKREPKKKKNSIDDLYSELFSEDEIETAPEFTPIGRKVDEKPETRKVAMKPRKPENTPVLFEEETSDKEEFGFLDNYDFDSQKEETLDDEIFERARQGKNKSFEDDSELLFGESEDEFEFETKPRVKKRNIDTSLIDDEDDEIFEKLERLNSKLRDE